MSNAIELQPRPLTSTSAAARSVAAVAHPVRIGDLVRVLPSARDCPWDVHSASVVSETGLVVDILEAVPGHAYVVALHRLQRETLQARAFAAAELEWRPSW